MIHQGIYGLRLSGAFHIRLAKAEEHEKIRVLSKDFQMKQEQACQDEQTWRSRYFHSRKAQGLKRYRGLGCSPVAARITASNAGFGWLLPSNKSGWPWARHESASFTPQNVTIFTYLSCFTNARKSPA